MNMWPMSERPPRYEDKSRPTNYCFTITMLGHEMGASYEETLKAIRDGVSPQEFVASRQKR
jgi:hypothetical protein